MRLLLGVLLASLIALVGCGGDGDSNGEASSDQPEDTLHEFYGAAAEGDEEASCALFTSDPGDSGNLLAAPGGSLPSLAETCAEKVADVNESNPGLLEETAEGLTVKTTEETADSATVELDVPGGAFTTVVKLVKSDGEWKIELAGNEQFVD